jgi:hypothetical protein
VIDGGLLLENIDKVGVANLLARMMTQGYKEQNTTGTGRSDPATGCIDQCICRHRGYPDKRKHIGKKLPGDY